MTTRHETIPTIDGDLPVNITLPESGTGPGVVLIQEIFGVNEYIRDVADRLASEGYVVLTPHMFFRIEDGFEINVTSPDDIPAALEVAGQYGMDHGIADTGAALTHLASLDEVTGPVGIIGFCFGGSWAYLAAAHHDPACAVSYYGSQVADNLDLINQITCPVVFHFGSEDAHLPSENVDALIAAAQGNDLLEVHVAAGAGHAFDNSFNPMFSNPEAAAPAWDRTTKLLADNLK